ncbi:hypothetical protein J4T96_gp088 [Mycobacterium phage Finemlucis]|uniref:Uncharacterized protein n=1 Tax=Mycobacterium phage Finemlucis TaxID=2015844 RepID=A0A291I9Z7_9CAUD|nr:hypothetical protein J4T96_gp088 [Mycobacterium phage Finemlucis]ATG86499.1 hypothetical protein SEA_FINEMLUCIS_88 [Mycobacterium phage Finemlucis]
MKKFFEGFDHRKVLKLIDRILWGVEGRWVK